MKWLKTYESFVENPKFFRFSKTDILRDKQSIEISPRENQYMVGNSEYIKILLGFGFPDLRRCIHFMDEIAFREGSFYKELYGKFTYKVSIDNNSLLGWSFMTPVNDWWYKSNPYNRLKQEKESVRELDMTGYGKVDFEEASEEELKVEINKLIDFGFIGTGNINNLMSSNLWGKEKVFIWTIDTVKIENQR
jgi:hypothetical protein